MSAWSAYCLLDDMNFLGFVCLLFFICTGAKAHAERACRMLFETPAMGSIQSPRDDERALVFISTDSKKPGFANKEMGRIEFDYRDRTDTLFIEWIEVHKKAQQLGISNQLIQAVLQVHPHTQEITGYLTDENARIYFESLQKSKDGNQAFYETPFYRSFSKFGFRVIREQHVFEDKVIFSLVK